MQQQEHGSALVVLSWSEVVEQGAPLGVLQDTYWLYFLLCSATCRFVCFAFLRCPAGND